MSVEIVLSLVGLPLAAILATVALLAHVTATCLAGEPPSSQLLQFVRRLGLGCVGAMVVAVGLLVHSFNDAATTTASVLTCLLLSGVVSSMAWHPRASQQ